MNFYNLNFSFKYINMIYKYKQMQSEIEHIINNKYKK